MARAVVPSFLLRQNFEPPTATIQQLLYVSSVLRVKQQKDRIYSARSLRADGKPFNAGGSSVGRLVASLTYCISSGGSAVSLLRGTAALRGCDTDVDK